MKVFRFFFVQPSPACLWLLLLLLLTVNTKHIHILFTHFLIRYFSNNSFDYLSFPYSLSLSHGKLMKKAWSHMQWLRGGKTCILFIFLFFNSLGRFRIQICWKGEFRESSFFHQFFSQRSDMIVFFFFFFE